ncbi:MAG: SMC-Scp complex subunit ScpB [Gammaproteobacteria bacterium]
MNEAEPQLEDILLAALFAADHPLTPDDLAALFEPGDPVPRPQTAQLEAALGRIAERLNTFPLELKKLAGGYRIEVSTAWSLWVSRLWVERPGRYSRALLETLALIAYRQPITRPEIEAVRGVVVNTNVIRTLTERGWIRTVGHRDAPGRPALYGTTRVFLDYFGLTGLNELPTLVEIRELSDFEPELPLVDEVAARPDAEEANEVLGENDVEIRGGDVVLGPWVPDGGDER